MNQFTPLKDQSGMASIEMVPLLFIFIFMFAYALGAFGIVHTGIKNSIGARNYAFETFRNRTNLVYFRDTAGGNPSEYSQLGNRTHGIMGEEQQSDPNGNLRSTERSITMGLTTAIDGSRNDNELHIVRIPADQTLAAKQRDTATSVSPVWVMVLYGICINAGCGG